MRQNNDTPQIEHAEGGVRNNYAVTVSSYLLITWTFHINMLFSCETYFIICNMAFNLIYQQQMTHNLYLFRVKPILHYQNSLCFHNHFYTQICTVYLIRLKCIIFHLNHKNWTKGSCFVSYKTNTGKRKSNLLSVRIIFSVLIKTMRKFSNYNPRIMLVFTLRVLR